VTTGRRLHVSTANSAFQGFESLLGNRTKRHRTRTFVVEGVLPLTRALEHGWRFAAVLHETGVRLSAWAEDLIARAAAPLRYELTPDLLARLSGRAEGSELLAVVEMPPDDLARIPIAAPFAVAVMDRPGSPGNLGTIVRSADALGARGVIVTGHGADPYDPATITASRGSLFALPTVAAASHHDVLAWVDEVRARLGDCVVAGADEHGAVDAATCDFTRPTVIVFGNEARGVSRAYREACDTLVRIPMSGAASSLNVAAAASIILYEIARQRRSGPP
jgi:TrmH family RNA methyltransferase